MNIDGFTLWINSPPSSPFPPFPLRCLSAEWSYLIPCSLPGWLGVNPRPLDVTGFLISRLFLPPPLTRAGWKHETVTFQGLVVDAPINPEPSVKAHNALSVSQMYTFHSSSMINFVLFYINYRIFVSNFISSFCHRFACARFSPPLFILNIHIF